MPRVDCSGASRVRENRMHGLERGGWKRSRHGHRASLPLYNGAQKVGTFGLWAETRDFDQSNLSD